MNNFSLDSYYQTSKYFSHPVCQKPNWWCCRIFLWNKIFPSSRLKRSFEPKEAKEEERQKEEEKREISHDFLVLQLPAYQQVSQAVSLSTMRPVTQPANKPTGPFHSVGPLAWDQVMPLNKELLSCITSPQRGHPGRSLLSPGTASLQHTKASTTPASLLLSVTTFSHYTTIILTLYPGRGFYFSFQEYQQKGQKKKKEKNNLNPSNGIFN